jgi:uncharacterized protein (DUF1800 family)
MASMKNILRYFCLPLSVFITLLFCYSFIEEPAGLTFPYKKAGLTQRQAAAHLLGRFTYGVRPGDIDAAVKMGLEKWFLQQLKGSLPDDSLKQLLSGYDAINLSNSEVVQNYPNNGRVIRAAVKDGVIHKDSAGLADRKEYREVIVNYMKQNNLKPQQELFRQLINQKILRAVYTNNQTREILTDFWFNHFNVSITKNICAEFIPAYERDVIRPNVFGKFENLVLATAKSPAMLMYLDNFNSAAAPQTATQAQINEQLRKRIIKAGMQGTDTSLRANVLRKVQQNKQVQGINENYAREVMELHTLGVDGGYTQSDVTQAARILTGWTIYPQENTNGSVIKNMIEKVGEDNLEKRGFIHEGDFLFAANRHDNGEKTVLGKQFPANGGYQEGVELLKMFANHPSAAKFISRKIAVRFVSDNPSQKLIDRMAGTFLKTSGSITDVLLTMVSSPEFWNKEALREKTKSPFELTISAVRALNAEISQPYQLFNWINRMGQKIYYYQAPTGFPDKGQYWINTGSLLNRMNFGLALASQKIPGVKVNLASMNKNREPESSQAALQTYSKLIMPERDLGKTIERLSPMLNDPDLQKKIEEAAKTAKPQQGNGNESPMDSLATEKLNKVRAKAQAANTAAASQMLAQVVGVILGSPEFQRK